MKAVDNVHNESVVDAIGKSENPISKGKYSKMLQF